MSEQRCTALIAQGLDDQHDLPELRVLSLPGRSSRYQSLPPVNARQGYASFTSGSTAGCRPSARLQAFQPGPLFPPLVGYVPRSW